MKDIFSQYKKTVKPVDNHEKDFKLIEDQLVQNTVNGPESLDAIARWYCKKYKAIYNCNPLDYNFFNTKRVIGDLASYFQCSKWEMCKKINKWFTSYHELGFSQNEYCERTLTVSMLRKTWVLDKMDKGLGPNDTVKSYHITDNSGRIINQGSNKRVQLDLSETEF